MPPPSPLAIATSSLTRLSKEESSYRTELASQQKRLQSLQASTAPDEDGNRDFQVEQEVLPSVPPLLPFESYRAELLGPQKRAVKETEAVFGPLRKRIETAVEALESLLVG